MLHNPSLREEPIDQPAAVIPSKQETSILDWLESSGRLMARVIQEEPGDYEDEIGDLEGLITVDEVGDEEDDEYDEIEVLDEEA